MNKLWKIWKYAIGSFSDDKTEPYDNYVAGIRTIIFVSYMVTNAFIVSGVLRHWHDVPSELHETQKKGYAQQKATFLKIEDAVFWEEHVKKNLGAVDTQITVH